MDKGGWRYQPVLVTDATPEHEEYYTIVEVYVDSNDLVESWTAPRVWPGGEKIEELQSDLARMLVDAYGWVPVRFEELRAGMELERALTMEQREELARMVGNVGFAAKPRIQ